MYNFIKHCIKLHNQQQLQKKYSFAEEADEYISEHGHGEDTATTTDKSRGQSNSQERVKNDFTQQLNEFDQVANNSTSSPSPPAANNNHNNNNKWN